MTGYPHEITQPSGSFLPSRIIYRNRWRSPFMRCVSAVAVSIVLGLVDFSGAGVAAQTVCDTVNRIIASGLEPNRPFAAVDALILPNAVRCGVEIDGDEGYYQCSWGISPEIEKEVEEIEDEIRDLGREKRRVNLDWARDLISDGEYRSERAEIEGKLERLSAEVDRLRGGSEEAVSRKHQREYGSLYSALYDCFTSNAIVGGRAYEFGQSEEEDEHVGSYSEYGWSKPGGCGVRLCPGWDGFVEGIDLLVYCPVTR